MRPPARSPHLSAAPSRQGRAARWPTSGRDETAAKLNRRSGVPFEPGGIMVRNWGRLIWRARRQAGHVPVIWPGRCQRLRLLRNPGRADGFPGLRSPRWHRHRPGTRPDSPAVPVSRSVSGRRGSTPDARPAWCRNSGKQWSSAARAAEWRAGARAAPGRGLSWVRHPGTSRVSAAGQQVARAGRAA